MTVTIIFMTGPLAGTELALSLESAVALVRGLGRGVNWSVR